MMVAMSGAPLRGARRFVCPPSHPLRWRGSLRFKTQTRSQLKTEPSDRRRLLGHRNPAQQFVATGNSLFSNPGDDRPLLNIGHRP